MEMARDGNGVVLLVVLLCALVAGWSEGRIQAVRPLFHHGGGPLPPPEMDQQTVPGTLPIFFLSFLTDYSHALCPIARNLAWSIKDSERFGMQNVLSEH